MHELYLEIGFEADLDTSETPELLEVAQQQCNENPATRGLAITELRKMIFERGECQPLRTDDEYLLRFLRVRSFIVPRAHKLLVRYCAFREQNKHLYEGVDLWSLAKVKDSYEGTLYDHPDVGRISTLRFGRWNTNEFPIEDLVRTGMAIGEIGIRQPKLQIVGTTVIVDLEGIAMRHVACLTPTIAYQIICLMGMAVPGRLRGVHIINYSWILNTFFFLFKRFIPQSAWSTIHFHGWDLKSLQKHIRADSLPTRYGGTCKNLVTIGNWLTKIRKYRDENFDKEMKLLGYVVKE